MVVVTVVECQPLLIALQKDVYATYPQVLAKPDGAVDGTGDRLNGSMRPSDWPREVSNDHSRPESRHCVLDCSWK
jgi:hypothetical protein